MTTVTEHTSRRELCEIICTQQDKLKHYQRKLGDLVRGYKSLQKEKEALEASLKALSSQRATESAEDGKTPGNDSENVAESREESKSSGGLDSGADSVRQEGEDGLPQKVAALSAAMVTLTEEKSRMEAAFQSDRRRLLQEKEVASKQLSEQEQAAEARSRALEAKISELRTKLREEQSQREKEESNHAAMLRELQRLLAQERQTREALEEKLEDVGAKVVQAGRAKEYEAKVQRLTLELEEVRRRLSDAEAKAKEPSPLLLKVQQEIVELKAKHQKELEQERARVAEAQVELQRQASGSESRVASLEGHLQELSHAVGNYDRLRLQDRAAIERLRERVAQLAKENAVLAGSVVPDDGRVEDSHRDSNLDVHTLLDRFSKLRQTLKEANQKSGGRVDLMAYFRELAEEEVLGLHSKCHEEQQQLKEEFEHYKARVQCVLKNGHTAKGVQESGREMEALRQQAKELQSQLRSLRAQHEAEEQKSKEKLDQLENALAEVSVRHRQEQSHLESTWRTKMAELESLMQGQRERTLALLQEKDRELQSLRAAALPSVAISAAMNVASGIERSSDGDDPIDPLLSELIGGRSGSNGGGTKAEKQVLFYVQELARKDAELAQALRAKHDLESALRDLRCVSHERENRDAQELDVLRLRLSQLEGSRQLGNGDGVNLQYLKNVVLQYLLCADAPARRHMLNAIATGLHFSPAEMELVLRAAWW